MNKRTLSYLIAGFILCTSLTAQTRQEAASTCTVHGDSTYVFHYPSCIRMFKANYKTNRQALQQLRRLLQTFEKGKDTLYVNGYSGESDTDSRNLRTAFHRSNNLKGYNYYGLRERDFKTVNIPHNHPDSGDIVLISFSLPVPTERTDEATPTEEPAKTKEPAKPEVAEDNLPVAQPQPQQAATEQPQAAPVPTP